MGHKFAEIAFTESVRQVQQQQGSRDSYAGMDEGGDRLCRSEASVIAERGSCIGPVLAKSVGRIGAVSRDETELLS